MPLSANWPRRPHVTHENSSSHIASNHCIETRAIHLVPTERSCRRERISPWPFVGVDYPRTWNQFEEWFATEDDCARYLARLRRPDGFACPGCRTKGEPYRMSRGRLICRACRHSCTVTSGTILDKTRAPLKVWLAAARHITSQKSGMSALGLRRVLRFSSYHITPSVIAHRYSDPDDREVSPQ